MVALVHGDNTGNVAVHVEAAKWHELDVVTVQLQQTVEHASDPAQKRKTAIKRNAVSSFLRRA